jgi:penicillin-insensitive murein DD-endopeptidase
MRPAQRLVAICAMLVAAEAAAQEKGTVTPSPLPPLAHPDDPKTPAKELFARRPAPTNEKPRAIGFYSAGCLAGGVPLPASGPSWQVMRLSRNRYWGHPQLIAFIERLGRELQETQTWPGLLIGDMSQPRGGPMITGHASHQVGLDVDIWLAPMPDRELMPAEREEMLSTNVVAKDRLEVNPSLWAPGHLALIHAAALDAQVERIFVNPAIKKALCRETPGDGTWLSKVRPYWGHDYHIHVRLRCPSDVSQCRSQPPPAAEDGCGKDLDWWFTDEVLNPKPPLEPKGPPRPLTVADLPSACQAVLEAP